MTVLQWALLGVGFAGCIGMSAFLSGMEAGLTEVSRLRLRRQAREGNKKAIRLQRYLDQPEDTLWTILVGNTLANLLVLLATLYFLQYLLGVTKPGSLLQWSAPAQIYWLLFGLCVLVFFTLCELLPKMVFRKYPNRLCLFLTSVFGMVDTLLGPLVELLRIFSRMLLFTTGGRELQGHLFGSREELRQMMTESGQGLSEDEREMIDRVLDLQKIPVRDLAVPFEDMPVITTETPVVDVVRNIRVVPYTRMPVWQESDGRRRIVGVVNLRRLIFLPENEWHRPAGHFLESALYQDEDIRLQKLLQLMQRSGQRVVIILDKRKRELGIVSLPDILKVVFGEVKV